MVGSVAIPSLRPKPAMTDVPDDEKGRTAAQGMISSSILGRPIVRRCAPKGVVFRFAKAASPPQ